MKLKLQDLRRLIKEVIDDYVMRDSREHSLTGKEPQDDIAICPECEEQNVSVGRSSDGTGYRYVCPACDHGWET
jgi:predicted RNA-binding Zn-ribbon protein involved in translation (DUF1610 family)